MKKMVTKILFSTTLLSLPVLCLCQEQIAIHSISQGIKLEDNQLFISDECKRLLSDAEYRENTYPEAYRFEEIGDLLKLKKYPLTLWYLINLYEEAPIFALQLVKDLSALAITPEDYVNAFYTYAYADPNLVEINAGRYHLLYPDLLEQKIRVTNLLAHAARKLQG